MLAHSSSMLRLISIISLFLGLAANPVTALPTHTATFDPPAAYSVRAFPKFVIPTVAPATSTPSLLLHNGTFGYCTGFCEGCRLGDRCISCLLGIVQACRSQCNFNYPGNQLEQEGMRKADSYSKSSLALFPV
ncbi:hypothetical protein B0J12DRAFT_81290 [Macrophomina phaseolina]|uniref:Uncharacterized protein n=1 Tax=Macrophomina phaseolina TaxID=35725 RepID=A0ABQ8GC01_9PEZI|nr:hypothetical protein B0J12DRAFT_81290 [Macrophomina phaseolina]